MTVTLAVNDRMLVMNVTAPATALLRFLWEHGETFTPVKAVATPVKKVVAFASAL